MKAVRVHQNGGPEVLRYEEIPVPEPGAGEARVKIEAVGLNYIDIYQRTGLYPLKVPFTLGMEGAGIVDAVGANVVEVKKGDRVAYSMHLGSYAEYAVVPAWKLVPLPRHIDSRSAAAVMLQGMTAHYLTRSTYPLKKGETALVHAAAGGVGLLLIQVAKRTGATVFGTVSTEEKAKLAREAGADEVILIHNQDGKSQQFKINTKSLFQDGQVDLNHQVKGGDVIFIPRAAVFYIYGEVQKPGAYRLTGNLNVMQAVSLGGGITPRGTQRGIQIRRNDKDGKPVNIHAALTDRVRENDVVYVKESLF